MSEELDRQRQRGVRWDDAAVPVGNAPPLPRWHVVAAGLAWLLGVGFLVLTAMERLRSDSF